jgi:hypothetical protein
VATGENVWLREWKIVRCYPTGGRAHLDADDVKFEIHSYAELLMELSSMKLLPEQEVQAVHLHLWTLIWQIKAASIDLTPETLDALRATITHPGLVCEWSRTLDLFSFNGAVCMTSTAMSAKQ